MMEKNVHQNFLLTGMSVSRMEAGMERRGICKDQVKIHSIGSCSLTKRPDLLDFNTVLKNAWFGVTVTRKQNCGVSTPFGKTSEQNITMLPLSRYSMIAQLTFPESIGCVVGTMTGAQEREDSCGAGMGMSLWRTRHISSAFGVYEGRPCPYHRG